MLSTVNRVAEESILLITLARSFDGQAYQSEFYALANRISEALRQPQQLIGCVIDVRHADLASGERLLALLDTLEARHSCSLYNVLVLDDTERTRLYFHRHYCAAPIYGSVDDALDAVRRCGEHR